MTNQSPAARQRAYQRRQRLGLTLITFEMDEAALINALLSAGLLDDDDALDPAAVARASARMGRSNA